jgi:hypothetical protein
VLGALGEMADKLSAVTFHMACAPEDAPDVEAALEASKPWPEGVTLEAHVSRAVPVGEMRVWLTATHSGEPIPFPVGEDE